MPVSTPCIRVRPDIYEKLRELSEKSRTPSSVIASNAIEFALGYVHLKEAKCYDVTFGDERKETKQHVQF